MHTHPILLAHGIVRFDKLIDPIFDPDETADDRQHYFRRIRSTLCADGFAVHHGSVSWAACVSRRAAELRDDVEKVLRLHPGARKVHIIAHSMGGLDARHMLFEHQAAAMHEKVASVSTIGTPHNGTSFADWGLARLGNFTLTLLGYLGISDLAGFRDLTTESCRRFNVLAESFEGACGVRFQTFAGTQPEERVFALLRLPWRVISESEGPNDGLVSLESAKWRDDYFQLPDLDADHLSQLGWWEPEEQRRPLFRNPAEPVEAEGRASLEGRIRGFYLGLARDLARQFPA